MFWCKRVSAVLNWIAIPRMLCFVWGCVRRARKKRTNPNEIETKQPSTQHWNGRKSSWCFWLARTPLIFSVSEFYARRRHSLFMRHPQFKLGIIFEKFVPHIRFPNACGSAMSQSKHEKKRMRVEMWAHILRRCLVSNSMGGVQQCPAVKVPTNIWPHLNITIRVNWANRIALEFHYCENKGARTVRNGYNRATCRRPDCGPAAKLYIYFRVSVRYLFVDFFRLPKSHRGPAQCVLHWSECTNARKVHGKFRRIFIGTWHALWSTFGTWQIKFVAASLLAIFGLRDLKTESMFILHSTDYCPFELNQTRWWMNGERGLLTQHYSAHNWRDDVHFAFKVQRFGYICMYAMRIRNKIDNAFNSSFIWAIRHCPIWMGQMGEEDNLLKW